MLQLTDRRENRNEAMTTQSTSELPAPAPVRVQPVVRPPCVPKDLWVTLAESEKAQLAPEDGGYMGFVPAGPWKCHYFTTWNHIGKPIATYDKTADGWTKRDWTNLPVSHGADTYD